MTKFWKFPAWLLACAPPALAGPLPPCAPDWKVEVVAEAPAITYSSVVCTSPDGRIFLGEDPADMPKPSDSASDKVACVYPDGQVLTFATNLHAVFGLQYIDGKLYVHNTPQFTVFDDNHSIGANRVDLIKSDNLHPWLPTFNDHIPSNCRLAMDGYLYISTGDKGIYGAVGTDGRKLEMRGGVYRMRPDGSGLEVYCTGTRNHLDVAINSEDEMFTYDNTDDGCGWWSRVTHMVDGGYYGYPYDYKPQRPYTLWMMVDYGAGAATGACAYDEDALPDEFHGNLFLCDWARAQVLRLIVERSGATYKVVRRVQTNNLDIMNRSANDDFHPVGICVTPDGKGFYVADWGRGVWKASDVQGRLFKLTYTGKTQEKPKPDWYIPAGTDQKFHATTDQLIAGLLHPAESVRLVAQRRLAERGQEAARKLAVLLKDTRAPPYARWFAIWTLDAIDGGQKQRKAILAALKDKDAGVQMQAARQLGTRRVREATKPLIALLQSTNAAVRLHAATALGRIGDPAAVPALLAALDEKDLFARYSAFFALRRIGLADPAAWPRILEGFASAKASVREGVSFAVRETYDVGLVRALASQSARQNLPLDTRTNIFSLLSSLSQKRPPWNGDWWNTTPANGTPAAKSVDWDGSPIVAAALRSAVLDPEAAIRKIAVDWVRSSRDTNAAAALAQMYQHETNLAVRAGILRDFGPTPSPAGRAIVLSILRDPRPAPALLDSAVEAAGKAAGADWNRELLRLAGETRADSLRGELLRILGERKMAEAVPLLGTNAAGTNTALRQTAIAALKQIANPAATDQLAALLDNHSPEVRSQAISALGTMKAKGVVPRLLTAAAEKETYDVSVTALAQIVDLRALDIYLDGLNSKNTALRVQCEGAVRALQQQALPKIEAKLATNDMTPQAVASLRQIYENDPNAKKDPLFRHKVLDVPIEQYQDFALGHSGDSRRGQRLFHDLKGVGCIRCHSIVGEGGEIGPDLTGIRSKYGRADIVESVLYPSKRILDGFQQVFFELKGEDDVSGIVRAENADEVTIIDSAGARHVLEKTNITSRKVSKISLMPEGLQAGLSLSEFSDLIAYVENPNLPAPPPPGGRPPISHRAGQPARPSVPKVLPPRLESPEDLFNPFVNIPEAPLTAPSVLVAAAPAPPEPAASPPPPPPAPPAEKAVETPPSEEDGSVNPPPMPPSPPGFPAFRAPGRRGLSQP